MLQKKAVGNRSEMFDRVKSAADKIIQIRLDTRQALVLATQIANDLKFVDIYPDHSSSNQPHRHQYRQIKHFFQNG